MITKKSAKPNNSAKLDSAKPKKKTSKSEASKPHSGNVIVVPQPAPGSYNPHRLLSKNTLLLHQVRHAQMVEKTLPEGRRTGHDPKSVVTEGDAAEYLRKITAILHPQGAEPAEVSSAPSNRVAE